MGMKSSQGSKIEERLEKDRVLFKQLGPAISKVRTTPGLFNVPFFVLLQVEVFFFIVVVFFCHLYLEKA